MTSKGFERGDLVEWSSQSAGIQTTKRGLVDAIVPADRPPEMHTTFRLANPGMSRNHESYIIRASKTGNAPLRTYWPRVSLLRKVAP